MNDATSNVKKDLREEILGHSEWAREKCVAAEALNYIEQLEAENKRLREALTRISETLSDVLDGSRVQEMQVRLGVQQDQVVALEAENKRLREALEARRDWFAAQLKSASKGNFSEWDRHALQIELDAANEALS